MQYNPRLDSIRGLAALAVVAAHWNSFLPSGQAGVQVFFVLSGYLITSILLEQKGKEPGLGVYLKMFFLRRVLRLAPLYFLFVGILTIAWLITGKPDVFGRMLPFLSTYTLNFAAMSPSYENVAWYTHLWTLAVEWQFYLLWPFVVWFSSRGFLRLILWALVVAAPLLRLLSFEAGWHLDGATADTVATFVRCAPWSQLDAFALGGLLAGPVVRSVLTRTPGVLAVLLGVGLLELAAFHLRSTASPGGEDAGRFAGMVRADIGYSVRNILSMLLIAQALSPASLINLVLDRRIFQYLGKISYGVYVWHAPIVFFLYERLARGLSTYSLQNVIYLALAIAITIGVADQSYRHYEAFFLRMKPRRAGRSVPGPLTAASAPTR